MAELQSYLIFSWEHNAFWRPNECGYTRFIERAGRYTKGRAEAICKGASYGEGRRFGTETDLTDVPPNEICFPAPEAFTKVVDELEAAGGIFRAYEALHLEKGTEEGARKAKANATYAESIEATVKAARA
jgi:hypothetical protein